MSNSLIPLPADLPENWEFDNIIAPNGSDIGMPVQYGYNYVMQQLNNTQKALNGFSGDIGKDYQSLLAALALRYSKEEVDALLSQHNLAEASHPYILSLLANKVEKGSSAKYDFQFLKGEVLIGPCKFWKNALNQVFYKMYFERSQGFAVQDIVATLPPGFRPAETEFFTHHPSNISTGATSTGVSGYITSEGEIKLTFFSDATYNRTRFEGWFQI